MATPLPEPFRDVWRVAGTRTSQRKLGFVSSTAETTLFEHGPTADAAPAIGRAADDRLPARSLFAVELVLSPSLPSIGIAPAAVLEMAAPRAKRQFLETVASAGLVVEDEREATRFERADGTTGKRYVLETASRTDTDRASADAIAAETHVAVWPTDEAYGMAGGTLPLEDGDLDTLDADLEIAPGRERKRVYEFVRTVDPGSGCESPVDRDG
ncbi:hypothetical protein [Natrialbaceae archaeon AArc-T1-2]|uniref:hypothetical protein n=1 Tax=Natrialbaceae archaeon AArc-T1-2 TaxID=3053904 RepID=UPI00255A8840|nr:hypothetical protein [Natrialbaceae archaeon AArc-T1-2]WIV67969.1 hypothetical protein QQ977_04350 [Natrialbaceae archaeon AArc-T1-2]